MIEEINRKQRKKFIGWLISFIVLSIIVFCLSLMIGQYGLLNPIDLFKAIMNSLGATFNISQTTVNIVQYIRFPRTLAAFVIGGSLAISGLIYQNTFKYGEIVTPPSDPIKVNDEEYSYTFNGWNTEITKVYENKDYTATFQKNIIKQEIIKERISIIKVLKIILISGCATVVVAVGLFIVIKKQSKKNVNNKI